MTAPDVSLAVQEDVLRLAVPVDDALPVEVTQPQDDLTRVEPAPVLGEARLPAHVVNVELQIPALHNRQNWKVISLKNYG